MRLTRRPGAALLAQTDEKKEKLREMYLADEGMTNAQTAKYLKKLKFDESRVKKEAKFLVEACRTPEAKRRASPVQALLHEYRLSSTEGVTLLSLAEALLRVRSKEGRSRLIADKLDRPSTEWIKGHLSLRKPAVVNAASTALAASEFVVGSEETFKTVAGDSLGALCHRVGADVVRMAVTRLMTKLGNEFVLGETIQKALHRAHSMPPKIAFSYDMLGEAARTQEDADRYFDAYATAIAEVGRHHHSSGTGAMAPPPGISVKLSALDPRFEPGRRSDVVPRLVDRVVDLSQRAADNGLDLTIDAEEASRLEMQLDVLSGTSERLRASRPGWEGLGLAVQAYQKRAGAAVDYVADIARRDHRSALRVRLVKGAYWDAEIKLAQVLGLSSFPVFTRKEATDASYQSIAAKLLFDYGDCLSPAFATHNARTVAVVAELARQANTNHVARPRLLGMGQDLHDAAVQGSFSSEVVTQRIYAPVGNHTELLAYLVRRLLENGANSSFVHALADDTVPADDLAADPVALLEKKKFSPHPAVPEPPDLFLPRPNSRGIDLAADGAGAMAFAIEASTAEMDHTWSEGEGDVVFDPSTGLEVGRVIPATPEDVKKAAEMARKAQRGWCDLGADKRAVILRKAADEVEARSPFLCSILVAEAGKTWPDAIGEVREAVDFLRYYADRGEQDLQRQELPSAVGEKNELSYRGSGIWGAIAPFNFPMAIFIGQVAGPLAAGNAVLAKSAVQTPLAGAAMVQCLHDAGVPSDVLCHLPGGPKVGEDIVQLVDGVVFTGSLATARAIHRSQSLCSQGPLPQLVAETAGLNALIADESALPEQLVADTLRSAFVSAGQRCSSARILFVPDQTKDVVLPMLAGAVKELRLGDPADLSVDCGPLIDIQARDNVQAHVDKLLLNEKVHLLAAAPDLDQNRFPHLDPSNFFPPTVLQLPSFDVLPTSECFGPVLHVLTYDARKDNALSDLLQDVNSLGYGLTCGLHSRLDSAHATFSRASNAGNLYVNRDTVAAVVEAQPFGGSGLSGTGPKAGGPNYVRRFAHEFVVTTNTAASGGDIDLMSRV